MRILSDCLIFLIILFYYLVYVKTIVPCFYNLMDYNITEVNNYSTKRKLSLYSCNFPVIHLITLHRAF